MTLYEFQPIDDDAITIMFQFLSVRTAALVASTCRRFLRLGCRAVQDYWPYRKPNLMVRPTRDEYACLFRGIGLRTPFCECSLPRIVHLTRLITSEPQSVNRSSFAMHAMILAQKTGKSVLMSNYRVNRYQEGCSVALGPGPWWNKRRYKSFLAYRNFAGTTVYCVRTVRLSIYETRGRLKFELIESIPVASAHMHKGVFTVTWSPGENVTDNPLHVNMYRVE